MSSPRFGGTAQACRCDRCCRQRQANACSKKRSAKSTCKGHSVCCERSDSDSDCCLGKSTSDEHNRSGNNHGGQKVDYERRATKCNARTNQKKWSASRFACSDISPANSDCSIGAGKTNVSCPCCKDPSISSMVLSVLKSGACPRPATAKCIAESVATRYELDAKKLRPYVERYIKNAINDCTLVQTVDLHGAGPHCSDSGCRVAGKKRDTGILRDSTRTKTTRKAATRKRKQNPQHQHSLKASLHVSPSGTFTVMPCDD